MLANLANALPLRQAAAVASAAVPSMTTPAASPQPPQTAGARGERWQHPVTVAAGVDASGGHGSGEATGRGAAVTGGGGEGGCRIADLCGEDKQKVATLIQQVVKVGSLLHCLSVPLMFLRAVVVACTWLSAC
jgi:hypothetical protein